MLQNLQIRSKLVAILILPLLALTVLASSLAVSRISASVQADRLAKITQFAAVSLTDLVDALQRERAVTNWYVASGHRRNFGTMIADRVLVNEAAHALDASVQQVHLRDYGPRLRADLSSAQQQLDQLIADGGQRARLERSDAGTADVGRVYDPLIAKLIATVAGIGAEDTASSPLTRNLAAFAALSRAKEASSQGQSLVLAALTTRSFSADSYHQLAVLDGRQSAWLEQFQAAASERQRTLFARTVTGRDIERINGIEKQLLAARGVPAELTPQEWFFPTSARADLLHQFELSVKDDVLAAASATRSSAQRQATVVTVAMALILALGVGLSLLLARSMARPLLVLERTARGVAEQQLPGIVERLQDAGEDVDLAAITQEATAPVAIRSRDEIGRLAEAFNAVHRVAVRVAVEQAGLRRSIGDMILNLARRSQVLIDRQLELIDDLEQDADDETLEQMFKLDHLATRMRRNAENLIVLSGGADAARRLTRPVPLVDVVRAAMSEVEDYQRVELLPIEEASLTGLAVADVVHLLAELIENATAFSPPGTKVQIATQRAAGGHVLEIEDRGLGMSDEELMEANQRLAHPPAVDFAVSRVLGLYVVGRLAQRHAIKVQLRHSWYGGVTALALLPTNLMRTASVPGLASSELPELVPPAPPAARTAAGVPAPPAGNAPPAGPPEGPDRPAYHLPAFEQAGTDWFETGSVGAGVYVPLRRHAPQQTPAPAVPQPQPPAAQAPPDGASASGPQAPATGLPRRVPRAAMAPGIASPQPPPASADARGRRRSPDQIRAMLSSYSTGLERGRRMAGGAEPVRPDNGKVSNGVAHGWSLDDPDGSEETS